MNLIELKEYLDFKADEYEKPDFIESDPIQLVHHFSHKEDQEIIAFLISSIAWGNRKMIIQNGKKLINIMGESPYDFVMNFAPSNKPEFVHRTFNSEDLQTFFTALKFIYEHGGLENSFGGNSSMPMTERISSFRSQFFTLEHPQRTQKHVADPRRNSACKRINMFLRWMVRPNTKGVDLGIWKRISTSELYLPLDVHTSRNARELGLLNRKQDDWKALEELMVHLRIFDPVDPVKYDFALFGIGAFEKF